MRIAVAAAVLLLSTSIAAAQAPGQTMSWDPEEPPGARFAPPPPPPAPMPVEPVTVSYRGHIIAADVASLGLMALGPVMSRDADLSGVGFAGFFVAAPLVHLAHGRGGAAAKSFGLRVGLPFIGLMAGYRLGPADTSCIEAADVDGRTSHGGCGDHGSLIGMLVGAAAGGVTAMYVDAKYLSRYETTRPAMWSAGVSPTRGGVALSVSGAF